MKVNKSNEDIPLENMEITDWDPADDFSSTEEMRSFLELEFLNNEIEFILEAINTVARAKGKNNIAQQAIFLQGKNPSSETIIKLLNKLGFSWENKRIIKN